MILAVIAVSVTLLQQRFAGRLVQSGFADEAAYEAALRGSWRASDYRDKVRRELLSHEQALHTARTNLANCQKTIEKLEKPDLAAMEDAASAAQAAWQQALAQWSPPLQQALAATQQRLGLLGKLPRSRRLGRDALRLRMAWALLAGNNV